MRPLLFTAIFLVTSGASFKYLVYSPLLAKSHVNFMGKLADALLDAGHEVVMLSPIINTKIDASGTTKIPQCEIAKQHQAELESDGGFVSSSWTSRSMADELKSFELLMRGWVDQCNATLRHPGLMQQLRDEKFDVAFAELVDLCAIGLFKQLGIEKWAITMSIATLDATFELTGAAANPAYVPLFISPFGEEMSFRERLRNTLTLGGMKWAGGYLHGQIQTVFDEIYPEGGNIREWMNTASLVFLNSEPYIDFPRPTTHKILEIGGITVEHKHKNLNKTWSALMDLRPRTIFMSFGTMAQSYKMPEAYKQNIRRTFKKFPDVTFIWKYEKPEHNISHGIKNLVETTWAPQTDMLRDRRLTAFITHGGQGSTTEATTAGVPLVAIPVMADQMRNAKMLKRAGLAVVLQKEDLGDESKLEEAVKAILQDKGYLQRARATAKMISKRPFSMKKIFVRNMEFLAEFGPLRQLDHFGTRLNFIQFYLIDVFAFIALVPIFIIFALFVTAKLILAICRKACFREKAKSE